ncbi:hypothetical protein C9H16_06650 [Salmonella enterica]|nr:hypothetical protein [Salmonella enterica]
MKYILSILLLIGELLSFNSYAAVVNQCSSSAPSETGFFTIYVSGGRVHTNINGCDYALPPSSPVPKFTPLPDGSSSSSFEFTFYPTGYTENINVKAGPSSFSESDYDKNHKLDFDKINDQTQRYCSQPDKCEPDEDGQGMYPKDDNDYVDFVKKDDASHDNSGSVSSGDSSSDGSTPAGSGSGSPDGTDSGTGMTGGSTDGSSDGTSSGSSTSSPSELEKPYPVNAGVSQLNELFLSCAERASSISKDTSFDAQYNSVAHNCNAILDRISSLLSPEKISSLSADNRTFLSKTAHGTVLACRPSTELERYYMKEHGFTPTEIVGSYVSSLRYRDNTLNFNYSSGSADGGNCDSIYQDYVSSQNKSSESPDSSSGQLVTCPVGYHLSDVDNQTCFSTDSDGNLTGTILPPDCSFGSDCYAPTLEAGRLGAEHLRASGAFSGAGAGHSDSGNGDNGDVVAAINSLHSDVNQNHEETMDAYGKLPQETPDLIEGYLSPKINSIIDGMKKEMTDDYNAALAEFKGVFGDIDSYVPDIKLSFDLPVQFTSGIRGRCVPLVFDFNITLVGFQPYHFHAEGVQACQLYDTYIRSIVEYMLYFLTALACRRVFTRAAEFVSSQP